MTQGRIQSKPGPVQNKLWGCQYTKLPGYSTVFPNTHSLPQKATLDFSVC